jgi:hypothetical protein
LNSVLLTRIPSSPLCPKRKGRRVRPPETALPERHPRPTPQNPLDRPQPRRPPQMAERSKTVDVTVLTHDGRRVVYEVDRATKPTSQPAQAADTHRSK